MSLDIEILVASLDVVGTVLIGIAALRVHHRVLYDHKIDKKVFRTMKVEQRLGIIGIFLIILGYMLQVFT